MAQQTVIAVENLTQEASGSNLAVIVRFKPRDRHIEISMDGTVRLISATGTVSTQFNEQEQHAPELSTTGASVRYTVVDPEICHGKPTFCGTRIMVSQVLEQVARGMAWDTIIKEWRGSITKDAIAEAVQLSAIPDRYQTIPDYEFS